MTRGHRSRSRALGVLLSMVALTGCEAADSTQDINAIRSELEEVRTELRQLRVNERRLRDELVEARMQLSGDLRDVRASLDERVVSALRQRGLNDPETQLKASLAEQTGLLPGESDKGVAYRFSVDEIVFLREHYVWAPFEDGHYAGYMLLTFQVEDGEITWDKHWMRDVPQLRNGKPHH